jgi:hypothetical protein
MYGRPTGGMYGGSYGSGGYGSTYSGYGGGYGSGLGGYGGGSAYGQPYGAGAMTPYGGMGPSAPASFVLLCTALCMAHRTYY